MKRDVRRIRAGFVVALVAAQAALWAGESRAEGDSPIAVIVSSAWSQADRIDVRVLRRIFLGKVTAFAESKVEPIHQAVESAIRSGFNRAVLRKTAANLSNYWIQQALSGGAYPPRVVESNQEAVDHVSRKTGAIGYVDARWLESNAQPGVRAIAVVVKGREILPSDPDYGLVY